MALAEATNWIVIRQGGITRRPGTIHVVPLRNSAQEGLLVEFEFNEAQAYCLVFNDSFIRFVTLGAQVMQAAQNITGITKANPAVVTYSGSDTYANGDRVWIADVVGMTEVNNREFTVAGLNSGANTFQLSGVDSSAYTTYSSGGTVSEIYEIASPYPEAALGELQFSQAGDTVYIAHPDYAPRKLVRTSELSWAISEISFEDGPYLPEDTQGTTMTPAATGAVHPVMSGLTTPSGTAANDDGDADAWQVFDTDSNSISTLTGVPGWWSYDFAGAATKIADAYWIQATDNVAELDRSPTAWRFQGYDGASWITLDSRNGETGWVAGERRYFEFVNGTGYQSYRLYVTAHDGDGGPSIEIATLAIHEDGDSQTAFNLTASAVTGINAGQGFLTTDVGRTIRLYGSDGKWRWALVVSRTSTTVVTIRLYGHALPDLNAITRWQFSAWSVDDGYPRAVGFFEDRLVWGRSDTEPRKVWPSRSASYEDHGVSDPLQDNDAINAQMTGGSLSEIVWLEELADLIVGTADTAAAIQPIVISSGATRIIGPADPGNPFSSTNIRQKRQATVLLFVDRYRKRIFEIAFDYSVNGYNPRELSILSDHLFLSGVEECCFQQYPHNICWYPLGNGRAVALTYERAQQIAGMTPAVLTDALIESMASIPSAGGDMAYMMVKRTIAGGTQRTIEYLAPFYESGEALKDAVYLDAALTYTGSAATGLTGLWHLRGETVGYFADGVDLGDAVVTSTGAVSAPGGVSATTITVGKRYTSRAKTLRLAQAGNADGSALGRRKVIIGLPGVDMLDTAGLEIASATGRARALPREDQAPAAGSLSTGLFEGKIDDNWRNDGVVVMQTDRAYPATIRALRIPISGEP